MLQKKKQSILAIGSHPDDIEFGCGGTLRKFSNAGHSVYLLIMTYGERRGDPARRKTEQARSCKTLGVADVFWGGLADTRISFYDDVIGRIEKVIDQVRPSHVFVHFGKDTHQDHRHTNSCAVVATRSIPNVLFYEGPTSVDFNPNIYVDIRDEIKDKVRCLKCHSSQVMNTNIEHQSILEIAKATAHFRGTQCRLPQAEAFQSLRLLLKV